MQQSDTSNDSSEDAGRGQRQEESTSFQIIVSKEMLISSIFSILFVRVYTKKPETHARQGDSQTRTQSFEFLIILI